MPWAMYVGGDMDNEVVPQVLERTPRGKEMPRRVKVPYSLKKKEIDTYKFGRPAEAKEYFEFTKGEVVFVPAMKHARTHPVWRKVNDLENFKTFDQKEKPSKLEVETAVAESTPIPKRVDRSPRGTALPGELMKLLGA